MCAYEPQQSTGRRLKSERSESDFNWRCVYILRTNKNLCWQRRNFCDRNEVIPATETLRNWSRIATFNTHRIQKGLCFFQDLYIYVEEHCEDVVKKLSAGDKLKGEVVFCARDSKASWNLTRGWDRMNLVSKGRQTDDTGVVETCEEVDLFPDAGIVSLQDWKHSLVLTRKKAVTVLSR